MQQKSYDYLVGASKKDITYFLPGLGMGGWANIDNIVESIDTRLYVRAFVIQTKNTGKKIVWVNAEITYITLAIRQGVLEKLANEFPELGFDAQNVMLTANHTHNAPGGLSHYAVYNMTIQGFCPPVCNAIVDGIVKAIIEANERLQPAHIRIDKGTFAPDIPVAFNRSISAYNANPDVEKVTLKTRNLAVDREMTLLRFDTPEGVPIASANWFGVHTTTVHMDIKAISSDNKGFAAVEFENRLTVRSARKFVAAFAQTTPGDITPNYVRHFGLKDVRGPSRNDFENVKINGGYQYQKALEIYERAGKNEPIPAEIDYLLWHVDFSNIMVDPEFANGLSRQRTAPPVIGVNFLKGTDEGSGLPDFIVEWLAVYLKVRGLKNEELHGSKLLAIDGIQQTLLGEKDFDKIVIPDWFHPGVLEIRRWFRAGGFGSMPILPYILPVQIFIIGDMALLGMVSEPTTVIGRRIKQAVEPLLRLRGIKHIVVGGYTNAYAGYATTYEEYEQQLYEGAHTLYGKWTGAGYQTVFRDMANELLKDPENRIIPDVPLPVFSEEELAKRLFRPKNKPK